MGNCGTCQAASRRVDAETEPWSGGGGEPATERGESGEGRAAGVKVTVRISKRRLQKLMAEAAGGGGAGGMTVEEVLAEIVSAGEVVVGGGRHRGRWEPALQSIPEVVES